MLMKHRPLLPFSTDLRKSLSPGAGVSFSRTKNLSPLFVTTLSSLANGPSAEAVGEGDGVIGSYLYVGNTDDVGSGVGRGAAKSAGVRDDVNFEDLVGESVGKSAGVR